jgi:translocation and assembly module TamB
MEKPRLSGKVTISESKINLDKLSQAPKSDIQVIETDPSDYDPAAIDDNGSESPDLFSALSADIAVHVPRNAWLKGQDVNAEIAGDITIRKKAGGSFLLSGPLSIIRGNYYFMGKNFKLTEGNVEFLGLKDINPNLSIETETRIKSVTIIATLHGTAREMMIDLSSDPAMEESAIISYLVFGKDPNDLSGNQAFSAEKTALGYTSGLLASELRSLLGDAAFIDTFSIESGSNDNTFGSVTFGKYITPEIFISHRQGLSEDEQSYQEITYELTPQIKLETQIGKDEASSADITWEFDF